MKYTQKKKIILSDILDLVTPKQEIEIRGMADNDVNTTKTIFKGQLKAEGNYLLLKELQGNEVTRMATVGDTLWIYLGNVIVS